MVQAIVLICIKNLLPTRFISLTVIKVEIMDKVNKPKVDQLRAISCPDKAYYRVFFPYTTIALTPDICWSRPIWIAKIMANLVVLKTLVGVLGFDI